MAGRGAVLAGLLLLVAAARAKKTIIEKSEGIFTLTEENYDMAVEEFDNKHVVQSKVVEGQGFGDRSRVSTDAKGCEGQGRPGCPKSLVVGDVKGEAAKILERSIWGGGRTFWARGVDNFGATDFFF